MTTKKVVGYLTRTEEFKAHIEAQHNKVYVVQGWCKYMTFAQYLECKTTVEQEE
jgi:hypothetical protein